MTSRDTVARASCAAHFRCFRATERGGRACSSVDLRETRGVSCFFSLAPRKRTDTRGETLCEYPDSSLSITRAFGATFIARRSPSLFFFSPPPCIVRARGRARADPRCATRYLCSTDHRRLRVSHIHHPRRLPSPLEGRKRPPRLPSRKARRRRRRAARR